MGERRFILVEVWDESRDVIKVILRDALCVAFLLAVLYFFEGLLQLLHMREDRRLLIETWEFRVVMSAWVFLAFATLIELLIAIIRGFKHAR